MCAMYTRARRTYSSQTWRRGVIQSPHNAITLLTRPLILSTLFLLLFLSLSLSLLRNLCSFSDNARAFSSLVALASETRPSPWRLSGEAAPFLLHVPRNLRLRLICFSEGSTKLKIFVGNACESLGEVDCYNNAMNVRIYKVFYLNTEQCNGLSRQQTRDCWRGNPL